MGALMSKSETQPRARNLNAYAVATSPSAAVDAAHGTVKVLLVGPPAAGKSAFVHRLLKQHAIGEYVAGEKPSVASTLVSLQGHPRVAVTLWDVPPAWKASAAAASQIAGDAAAVMLFVDGSAEPLQEQLDACDGARDQAVGWILRARSAREEAAQDEGVTVGHQDDDAAAVTPNVRVFTMLVVNKVDILTRRDAGSMSPQPGSPPPMSPPGLGGASSPITIISTTQLVPALPLPRATEVDPRPRVSVGVDALLDDSVDETLSPSTTSVPPRGDDNKTSASGVVTPPVPPGAAARPAAQMQVAFAVDADGLPIILDKRVTKPTLADVRKHVVEWARAHRVDAVTLVSVAEDAGIDETLKRVVRGVITQRQQEGDGAFAAPQQVPEMPRAPPREPWFTFCASASAVSVAEVPTPYRGAAGAPIILPQPAPANPRRVRQQDAIYVPPPPKELSHKAGRPTSRAGVTSPARPASRVAGGFSPGRPASRAAGGASPTPMR